MEQRDLYDINRKLIGKTIFKGDTIPENNYIVVVLVFIQNSEGKFLIQKRSKNKNGKYATTGGHPKSGESSIQGIISEVREEIGIELKEKDIQLYYTGRSDDDRVFWDDYYIKMDIDNIEDLILQKEEVESVCWLSEEEIYSLMKENEFFINHYEEFEILVKWLKEKYKNRKDRRY